MKIKDILKDRLINIYLEDSGRHIEAIGKLLEPDIEEIVSTFYKKLLKIQNIYPILENAIVQKNLPKALKYWLHSLFTPISSDKVQDMIEQQKKIGDVHANINISLGYFTHGIGILKHEIYSKINQQMDEDALKSILIVGDLFDIVVSIISESYFSSEMVHESNELSLKFKSVTQNTALECERLRSMLLDWLRNTLTFLYTAPKSQLKNLLKLQHDNFGLWVIYKSDFLSHTLNISSELKIYIHEIDKTLEQTVKYRLKGKQDDFLKHINILNDKVTKCSWFISTIVDQALEINTGTDHLTRLFNRRYLNTILRRQTNISFKQGLGYALFMIDIDYFKKVNDQYGHESGDIVLKRFAEILLLSVRTSDFVFRYGGEEFLIILGHVDKSKAFQIAEKIRLKCSSQLFTLPCGTEINITCSIGAAVYNGHPDYNRLIQEADAALYQAKANGRNQVVMSENQNFF